MNIRSLSGLAQQVLLPEKPGEKQAAIKMQDTTDRDADGRQSSNDKKRKVTEAEIQKILDSLRSNPGLLANNLTVLLVQENEVRLILIQNPEGETVRRIPEEAFYQLLDSMDLANGRIFNKAA